MAQTCQAKQMSCSASISRTCSKTAIWLRAKNWIETYQNASKPQMDCQLCVCVWKCSLSPSPDLRALAPQASFPSRPQDQKVLHSFQRFTISVPCSLQEGSTFMISQGEQAQFLSSTAKVSWGICAGDMAHKQMACGFLSMDFSAILWLLLCFELLRP